jgi:hypothetical protein
MKSLLRSKKAIIAATVVGALAAGVGAYAVAGGWTSPQGSGTGSATAWTAVASAGSNSTTAPGGVLATALYPGGSAVNGVVSITNPNPYAVVITNIDNNGGSDVVATNCLAGSVNAVNQDGTAAAPIAQTNAATSIPAGGSGLYTVGYTMISTADNSCQGQTFNVHLHISAASASF